MLGKHRPVPIGNVLQTKPAFASLSLAPTNRNPTKVAPPKGGAGVPQLSLFFKTWDSRLPPGRSLTRSPVFHHNFTVIPLTDTAP